MSDRAAAAAIPPSGARKCRLPGRGESRRRCAPSGLDSLVHSQYARRPAARQHPLQDAEIVCEGVSCGTSLSLHLIRSPRIDLVIVPPNTEIEEVKLVGADPADQTSDQTSRL